MNEESLIFSLGVLGFFGGGSLIVYVLGKTIFKQQNQPSVKDV